MVVDSRTSLPTSLWYHPSLSKICLHTVLHTVFIQPHTLSHSLTHHVCFRQYSLRIRRPYEVHFDPYTQSVQILNSKDMLHQQTRALRTELDNLQRAIDRIQCLTMAA